MSIYKITFKYIPLNPPLDVKYVTADEVDCYSDTATFTNRIPLPDDPNPPFGFNSVGGNYRTHVVASFKEWLSVEEVESIPFDASQSFDSPEDI